MVKRRRDPLYTPPSPQEIMDRDLDSVTRHLLMQDPLVKQREKEIRAELQKGVTAAKKSVKKAPKKTR